MKLGDDQTAQRAQNNWSEVGIQEKNELMNSKYTK
jgi:hypothetical protein